MIVSETNQDTISGSKVKQLLIQNNLDFLNSKRKDNKRSLLSSQLNETNNGRELRSSSINNLSKLNPKRVCISIMKFLNKYLVSYFSNFCYLNNTKG